MKNKFLKIFSLDLSYFLIFLVILIVSRLKIAQLLLTIQSYSPKLTAINPNEDVVGAQNLINELSSLTNHTYLFLFIIIPLIIFLVYALIQGYSFYLLKKEKNYLLKFSLVSLPSLIFLSLLIFNPNIYLLIILILTMYFSFFIYFKKFNKIKEIFTKFYKFFPLYLIYLILSLIIISVLFVGYIIINFQPNYFIILIIGIIFIMVFSYYKIKLVELFN